MRLSYINCNLTERKGQAELQILEGTANVDTLHESEHAVQYCSLYTKLHRAAKTTTCSATLTATPIYIPGIGQYSLMLFLDAFS